MPLTEEDAARLAALGHPRERFTRVLGGTLTLNNVDGACYFLKDERCSVYADRPAGGSLQSCPRTIADLAFPQTCPTPLWQRRRPASPRGPSRK